MDTRYAKAYMEERMTHAQNKREVREARLAGQGDSSASSGIPIRNALGEILITLGERLTRRPAVTQPSIDTTA